MAFRVYTQKNITWRPRPGVGGSHRFAPRAFGMGDMGSAAGDFVNNLVGGVKTAVTGKADEISTKLDRVELALKISTGAAVLSAIVALILLKRRK